MTYSEEFSDKVHACRELYLKYDGEKHELIEQEMRCLGYHDFHRRVLYRRFERGNYQPSWVERFGWTGALRRQREMLKKAERNAERNADTPVRMDAAPAFKRTLAGGTADEDKSVPARAATPHSALRTPHLQDFPEFKAWLERTWPTGRNWDWKHLNYIYKHLKRVWDGDCRRLMIFMPPRHGKSELVTARFPAWTLKHKPETKIIIGCYNQPLANRFSRMVRSCLAEDETSGGVEEKGSRGERE